MKNNMIQIIETTANAVSIDITTREVALKKGTQALMLAPGFSYLAPDEVSAAMLSLSQQIVSRYNSTLDKSQAALKWKMPVNIEPFQLAMVLVERHHAINVVYVDSDDKACEIALYDENEGIYVVNDTYIMRAIIAYSISANRSYTDEVFAQLRALAPRRKRPTDMNLIPVNNGVFNYKTKQLLPFDPDFVFLTKSKTNYNANAKNVVIKNADGTDWDVESWMADLTDDPEITNLLWEITGALLRPNVSWDKSAWLYSDRGENGKGTLCAMWRNLCGSSATSIPIADFAKDFMLSSLITSQAIIVDENDVGTFIDKAGDLKAVITNDVIYINRKRKDPIPYQFHGFMVQCLNELPRFRDKSDSIYRRQLFIPMSKCFTGKANVDIKKDYINRPEVLEYVMKRVLEMDYYKLSEPAACKFVLEEYKTYNDPVRQFWSEFEDQFVWDFIPYTFLFSLYKSWFKQNNPSGSIMGRNTFMKDLRNVVSNSQIFGITDPEGAKIRVGNMMDKTETLIATYNLTDWQTPGMNSSTAVTVEALCRPHIIDRMAGIVRK